MTTCVYYFRTSARINTPLVLGFMGLYFLGLGGLMAVLDNALSALASWPAVIMLIFICGVLGWCFRIGFRKQMETLQWNARRVTRIDALMARPGAAVRFPHRVVERHKRSRKLFRQNKPIDPLYKTLPVGSVVRENGPPPVELPPPAISDVPFEPVAINDEEQLRILLHMGYGATMPDPLLPEMQRAWKQKTSRVVAFFRARRRFFFRLGIGAAAVVIVGFVPYQALMDVMRGNVWAALRPLIYAFPIYVGIKYMLYPTTTWLMPGTLVQHVRPLFSGKEEIRIHRFDAITVSILPLALQVHDREGKRAHIMMSLVQSHATLCAMFSQAPWPTDEEIHEFLEGR